jgi:hypothetical protein
MRKIRVATSQSTQLEIRYFFLKTVTNRLQSGLVMWLNKLTYLEKKNREPVSRLRLAIFFHMRKIRVATDRSTRFKIRYFFLKTVTNRLQSGLVMWLVNKLTYLEKKNREPVSRLRLAIFFHMRKIRVATDRSTRFKIRYFFPETVTNRIESGLGNGRRKNVLACQQAYACEKKSQV